MPVAVSLHTCHAGLVSHVSVRSCGCRSARGVPYSGAAPPGANPARPMTDGTPLAPAPQIGRFAGTVNIQMTDSQKRNCVTPVRIQERSGSELHHRNPKFKKPQFRQIHQERKPPRQTRRRTKPRTVDLYGVFCGVPYVLKSGCQWRMLPVGFPNWHTCYKYFSQWSQRPGPEDDSILEQVLKNWLARPGKAMNGAGRPASASWIPRA